MEPNRSRPILSGTPSPAIPGLGDELRRRGVVVVGAGAVGGYIAGHLTRAGWKVAVIEPWQAHAEAIRRDGLAVAEPSQRFVARLSLIDDTRLLGADPPALVVLCCKIPDAGRWVDRIDGEGGYRGPWLATLNGLADQEVGRRTGVQRTMGCIVTGLFAELEAPGVVRRHRDPGRSASPLFRVGELAGPAGERVADVVRLLACVDVAEPVDDLLQARWTKLVFNAMTSPLCAVTGRPTRELFLDPELRTRMLQIALEAARVAAAGGVAVGPLCGGTAGAWRDAVAGDRGARSTLDALLLRYGEGIDAGARSGMAQDLARGRSTEIDAINGVVVGEAARHGIDAPANRAIVERLRALSAARAP